MTNGHSNVTIRDAQPPDIDQLAMIYREDAAYHTALAPDPYVVPEPDEMALVLREQLGAPGSNILVAETREGVIGFITIDIRRAGDRPGMLQSRTSGWLGIAVGEEYHEQGIGSQLMTEAEHRATAIGADEIVLDCHAANTPAIHFYERLGYRTRETHGFRRRIRLRSDICAFSSRHDPRTERHRP